MKLEATGLDVAHGRTQVLFDVSLTFEEGASTCVLGRNGAGKTSLMNAVMGILPVRSGSVTLDGRELAGTPPWERVRAGLGYAPQERTGFGGMSVLENLRVVLEARPGAKRSDVDEVLDLFPRLKPFLKRPVAFLSGGQRQQLAIARALLTKPRLLLLDEPTEGIQPSIVAEIEEAILALRDRDGIGLLIAEQYVEMALRMSDRYVVLEAGHVVAAGATADMDHEAAGRLLAI
ncbi:ATP-binding cassette domain-containing protein [Patulibacter brassicae]|jgi:urea transport system ATP-binding protein|uniref:ATP-binding cassette domain-containing protein n=1 Tax=Patulibacter brassicae TaxID=1705717 RepID=A0ABU4VKE6_9ACTN|nr:ATP-binding cassette domain-containing protein [Patulibacter brassicae]MDX8152159.1 ATP-binding cassette domain-containing protein [Patulibacter brassicae]